MDAETLSEYDRDAAAFAQEWDDQPTATDLRDTVLAYFAKGPTADIGCGSGRDAAWLSANGFPTVGYDPSAGLLTQARRLHPEGDFRVAALPELAGVADGGFANVLCETVIMHLPAADVPASVRKLGALLAPGGTLYLSWRVTEGADRRDDKGRLYAAFEAGLVRDALVGLDLLLDEERTSASSGKTIHRIVARKS